MNSFKIRLIPIALALMPSLSPAAELQLTRQQMANVKVATTTVTMRESRPRLNLTGTLIADRRKSYNVAPMVDGLVIQLQVVAHENVHQGQVLALVRSNTLGQAQADYLEALARFDLAQTERTRIEGLWKEGVVAESRWLKVDSEYKSARATLEARRRSLSLTGLTDAQIMQLAENPDRLAEFELTSPIDGIVTRVGIEPGQLLPAGQTAFHVDDLSTLWAMVKIPVASLPQIKPGIEAVIQVQASPGQLYRGKLESLGGEVDTQSQTLTGRIVLENPDGRLRPGMYAGVSLSGVASQGLMAPASAIFRIGDQNYVFKVLGSGRFEPVAIEAGLEADGWVPIFSGIMENTTIVSSGVAELKSHWQYQGGE